MRVGTIPIISHPSNPPHNQPSDTASPPLKVLLISTYELGRQPFGLASPAAWLRAEGVDVICADLSVDDFPQRRIEGSDMVAFFVPMHTATRLTVLLIPKVKSLNPRAHICCYGLYAPMNQAHLRRTGADTILGGEFEEGLASLCRRLLDSGDQEPPEGQLEPLISIRRQEFIVPDRQGLPPLSHYARLHVGEQQSRTVGYVEASRGCKHLCRHCPIVPVYRGKFRIVQSEVVLQDIRQQVEAGAEHITFGDPDFFNGIGHAIPLIQALHEEFPAVSYDVTIKVEHLLKYTKHLPTLRETGCAMVTTAVESIDDRVLAILDKGHTREDFIGVVKIFNHLGLNLNPTFVPFSPWITLDGYLELLELLTTLDLIDSVSPIQLAIRLLIPAHSKLLELPEVRSLMGPFEEERLSYDWSHQDPGVDRLYHDVRNLICEGQAGNACRRDVFDTIWTCVQKALHRSESLPDPYFKRSPVTIPYMTEPWYC